MRYLLIILGFVFVAFTAQAQRTIAADTLKSTETINFTAMPGAKVVSATCTNIGGTSDGTLTLYGSTDNSVWTFINYLGGILGITSPKASITGADLNQVTITDGLVANWVILDADPFAYRVALN